jgi:hypothetical protein
MQLRKPLFSLALAAALSPSLAATTYDFQTVAGPDAGTSFACTGSDRCSSAAPSFGGAMSFYGGAVSATGWYDAGKGFVQKTSVLDNFSDRPKDRPDLKWVGLGVYHKLSGNAFVSSDDNITANEKLVLTFTSAVLLTDVILRAEGHYANFASGAQFGVASGAGPIVNFNFTNGVNNYNIANANLGLSDTWTFYGFSDDSKKQYYVSSVTAVPEPGTYALMVAGLAAVGFVARRRSR